MIDIGIIIRSRSIPATPRSKDYPQGWIVGVSSPKKVLKSSNKKGG